MEKRITKVNLKGKEVKMMKKIMLILYGINGRLWAFCHSAC